MIDPSVAGIEQIGEEVRINLCTYEFIRDNELYNVEGLEKKAAEAIGNGRTTVTSPIDLPVTSQLAKAKWIRITEQQKARYHWRTIKMQTTHGEETQVWGLAGLHIITKDTPNWFWCTFEHIDTETTAEISSRDLTTRGQNAPNGTNGVRNETKGSKWENYRLRGTQTEFTTSSGPFILANSQVEHGFQMTSSCMTCHARATIGLRAQRPDLPAWQVISLPVFTAVFNDNLVPASVNPETLPELIRYGAVGAPDPEWYRVDKVRLRYIQSDFLWTLAFRPYSKTVVPRWMVKVISKSVMKTPVVKSPPACQTETERLLQFFEEVFQRRLKRSPMQATSLGLRDGYDKWDDLSDDAAILNFNEAVADLKTLADSFEFDRLEESAQLSYKLFKADSERTLAHFPFRLHDYPVNQLFGWQSEIPSFLINSHLVNSHSDAEAYIARLNGIPALVGQLVDGLNQRAEMGVIAPKFVFKYVIADCRNIVRGFPLYQDSADSPLMEDFRAKVMALQIPAGTKDRLLQDAATALLRSVYPAYQELIAATIRIETVAGTDAGVWKLPQGNDYYSMLLAEMTTTGLSAAEIHDIGLEEVARIRGDMEAIMRQVGFSGTLEEFFAFMRSDPQFFYPNNDEGGG